MKFQRSYLTLVIACAVGIFAGVADGGTLRIVSYNIDCSDQSSDDNITGPAHSLPTVVQAIGLHHIGTNAQPMDLMNCEELQSTTLSNFCVALNNIYGAGTYTYDTTTDTNTGGGPDGLIYNTHTVQVVSARALRDGHIVLLQSNGTYVAAYSPGGGTNGVTRSPMLYQIRPIGYGTTNDFYMYVCHARSTSDDSQGDARYAEAQEVRSDAKYKLPAGSHILYAGDWNLFNGGLENAYKCLTGQTTSDGTNWSDTSSIWANTNQTQGYDPTSKTTPPTITSFANVSGDNATYLYDDSTDAGSYCMTSRLDIQLPNAMMYGAYNTNGGVQLAPDTSDPYDTSDFPSSKYPYAFEVFGNNGTTPIGSTATVSSNHSLDDLTNTVPNAATVYTDLVEAGTGTTNFVGSDHYPIVGDYVIVTNTAIALTPYQAWQLQYFGCTNCPQAQPTADADGTGQDNAFKFVAGLNPTNAASVFVFTAATSNQPGTQSLIFSPAVSGRIYTPQFTTNIISGTWQNLTTTSGPVTNGSQVTITDTNATQSAEFYRINISYP